MDEANILFLTGAEKKPLPVDDQGNGLPVNPGPPEAADATVPIQILKTVADPGTPEALAVDGTFFRTATLIAHNDWDVSNTGNVRLGASSINGRQPVTMPPGSVWNIIAPDGQKYDLNDYYLDVDTAADGVVIEYS